MQSDNSLTPLDKFNKEFEIYYLGVVRDINLGGLSNRDVDVQLIDKVEEAQVND